LNSSQRAPIRALLNGFMDRIQRHGLLAGDLKVKLQVVLQILPHSRQILHQRDAQRTAAQQPGPTPESFKSCGELIGAAAQQHFAPRAHVNSCPPRR
jgi:hypothetical protein